VVADRPNWEGSGALADTSRPVRPLTSRDLAAAAGCADVERARLLLARRAIDGGHGGVHDHPPPADISVEIIARQLHEIDPLAVILLDVQCPACDTAWECELDVAGFLWTEIETEALRILRDVHALAIAYGWREADILTMSALRRAAYLELVQ
jgi:hypothetical protein